jgi:hypothetical protein
MAVLFLAAETDVAGRVKSWSERLRLWEEEADALVQREELRRRRVSVRNEQELVDAMRPSQQLVRPLLVSVPEGWSPR